MCIPDPDLGTNNGHKRLYGRKIAEKDHCSSIPGWNPGSDPSSNPGSDPSSSLDLNKCINLYWVLSKKTRVHFLRVTPHDV